MSLSRGSSIKGWYGFDCKRNSRLKRAVFLLVVVCLFSVPAKAKYGGTGEPNKPYRIATAEDLNDIGNHVEDFNKCFVLVNDIDLGGYSGTQFNIIGEQGQPFVGVFDGNGHTISNFTYSSTAGDVIGLFGYVDGPDAEIKDLRLVNPDIEVVEGDTVGSLVGWLSDGSIRGCHVENASVVADDYVGGLVGWNYGDISSSYSKGTVDGDGRWVGGLVGYNVNTVTNCYSTSSVVGGAEVGGLVGRLFLGTVSKCYSVGSVSGTGNVGGLVGRNLYNAGTVTDSFWDVETSLPATSSAGGIGKSTAQMQMESTFTSASWDFTTPIWKMCDGPDYPRLWWEKCPSAAPVACVVGGDQIIEAESDCEAMVSLDGSCSSDSDSTPGTNDDINDFNWYEVDPCDSNDILLGSGEAIECNLPIGEHIIILEVIDKAGASDTNEVTIVVQDTMPPEVQVVVPQPNAALQDGVTLTAEASDICGVAEVYFYLREPGDANGVPIGYEGLESTLNTSSGKWEYDFDTTELEDGYYVILAKAVDTYGNEGSSELVHFSIRNWAVLELLPATRNNNARRTMPVKFSVRIAESVDPTQPFVYNEELEVRIYDAADPDDILQISLYGDTARDYRIDSVEELYIANFKTKKQPAEYVVEIWRTSKNFLVGSFTFETVNLAHGDLTGESRVDVEDLLVMAMDWLQNDSIADIAPTPDGDDIVNFQDFAVLADNWLAGVE